MYRQRPPNLAMIIASLSLMLVINFAANAHQNATLHTGHIDYASHAEDNPVALTDFKTANVLHIDANHVAGLSDLGLGTALHEADIDLPLRGPTDMTNIYTGTNATALRMDGNEAGVRFHAYLKPATSLCASDASLTLLNNSSYVNAMDDINTEASSGTGSVGLFSADPIQTDANTTGQSLHLSYVYSANGDLGQDALLAKASVIQDYILTAAANTTRHTGDGFIGHTNVRLPRGSMCAVGIRAARADMRLT